ncbi:NAD(P)-dependent dehydrogenase (short-subunit alcohol dehydrogenase family) [Hoeflea marina]|uniref:NAD(P)-dependent dehydrogenase (Short-subunit alcohol dehydrogenase family) n=1 Tax=Hoeflea marina TaxID=274592 RepID=A0A317PR25_9HYPH|nr:SDR family oxidoreductase [Hoeflea marina]PWW03922.1 NAD(P)-dependent dehydrogenase (short-subunit alcohol dehydrogenase family) [Hoeflea marina]
MADFSGRVVIITGAAGGFGAAAAALFAAAGAHLVLSDISADGLSALAGGLPGDHAVQAGDISDPALSAQLVRTAIDRFGHLDIAVNNAGIAHDMMPLQSIADGVARRVIDIDLMGVFYAMKAQIPAMSSRFRKDGVTGSIVNVASIAGVVGAPMLGVYAAAKHGVIGLTKSAAIENAQRGIRINALCPSFARTPMATDFIDRAGAEHRADAEARLVRAIPMGRLAEVSEVMAGLVYLADPANSFVTGQAIHVDGGLTAC